MTETTIMLKSVLGRGKENAVKRSELAATFGGDRIMRKAIEQARIDGICVCNDQDGKGYYIARDIEEVRRQHWQILNRAKSNFDQLKAFRAIIRQSSWR